MSDASLARHRIAGRTGTAPTRSPLRSAWSALSARWYLPALAIPAAATALIGYGLSVPRARAAFGDSATGLRAIVYGPASLVVIGVILVVERLRPAQLRPLIARGHRHDALLTLVNALVVLPFVAALSISFSVAVRAAMPWIVLPSAGAPRWMAVALIFLAMDFCNWLVHLANHRSAVLWRFHELHHSQEDMSVLTVFRTHPLIHVSYLVALVPAIVLLANGALTTGLLVTYAGIVAFAHSNTNLGFGPLERILVSPNFHRIHHQLHGPQDVNLGFALTVWDQLFGTVMWPTQATIRCETGLPGRPLTVEHSGSRPRHLAVLAAQLIAPFRPSGVSSEPALQTNPNNTPDERVHP